MDTVVSKFALHQLEQKLSFLQLGRKMFLVRKAEESGN